MNTHTRPIIRHDLKAIARCNPQVVPSLRISRLNLFVGRHRIERRFGLLATGGTYCSVGLVGTRINIPLFPFVAREFTYHGSFWGNYNDLSEIVMLAQQGKIKHTLKKVRLEDINENLELLRDGDIIGRAVVTF
jgi:D-arabinose 1-dehydrogenase-like Zn-dependent alcohol dehydrogenase